MPQDKCYFNIYRPHLVLENGLPTINSRGENFTFIWDDSEENAKLIQKNNERVRFKWQTDEEENNDYYLNLKFK